MTTTLAAPRQLVPRRSPTTRISVGRRAYAPLCEDLDELIERLRCDVFDLYVTIREAQRERSLSPELRLRILGEAARDARNIADTIHRRQAAATFDLDLTSFGVPI